jgi:hypothetical protein
MVSNVIFNNISAILWRSVLLVEESGVPGENLWPAAIHWQTLSHNVVSSTPDLSGIRTHMLVVIGTDYIGSCKSNYDTITNMTVPYKLISKPQYVILNSLPYNSSMYVITITAN